MLPLFKSWITPGVVAVVIVEFVGCNYLYRPESPEDAWRRAYQAMLAGDYGTVYDCLPVDAQREADVLFAPELAKEADRRADSAAAARLQWLRNREAYIEACIRTDRSVPQVLWTDIDRTELYGDRARLMVSRPPIAAQTTGTVDMVRENGEWKIGPMVPRR
jgi:hypothetical protein